MLGTHKVLQDGQGINWTVMNLTKGNVPPNMAKGIIHAMVSSQGGDMVVLVGCDESELSTAADAVLRDNPQLRGHFLSVDKATDFTTMVHEYTARLDMHKQFEILFLVCDPDVLTEAQRIIEGRDVDGDDIVTWPRAERFWVEDDRPEDERYAPFNDREDMLDAHRQQLSAYMDKNPRDRVFFNPGADFLEKPFHYLVGMVVQPRGILERNTRARQNNIDRKRVERARVMGNQHEPRSSQEIEGTWEADRLFGQPSNFGILGGTRGKETAQEKLMLLDEDYSFFVDGTEPSMFALGDVPNFGFSVHALEGVFEGKEFDNTQHEDFQRVIRSRNMAAREGRPGARRVPQREYALLKNGPTTKDAFRRSIESAYDGVMAAPQPTDLDLVLRNQAEMEAKIMEFGLPVFNGFEGIPKDVNSGIIVATSGAGKSTYVEANKSMNPMEAPHLFQRLYSAMKSINDDEQDGLNAASLRGTNIFYYEAIFDGVEAIDYIKSIDWVDLLRVANEVRYGQGRSAERTMHDLMKKAGESAVFQNPDPSLANFSAILKDFDPLSIMIGKTTNKLVQFMEEKVEEGYHGGRFAQMFFYAMTGAGPWDDSKRIWNGVVPQMINVTAGVWNGLLWSTSPFGLLYLPSGYYQSVVPLFPELMTSDMDWQGPKHSRPSTSAIVTELDARLGYAFGMGEGMDRSTFRESLRDFEWVLDGHSFLHAGSGTATVRRQRSGNRRIYDVDLQGEHFHSTHDPTPHVTFDEVLRIAPGTTIPIRRIEQRDGTRIAHVEVDGTPGHITLGLPPKLFAADQPVTFEVSERYSGKVVILLAKEDIKDTDVVFRCGELFDVGMFLYFQMVNRSLMGTGKLASRMTFEDILQKARLRINENIDRSGHVDLAANLPPLQRNVFLASVASNEYQAYDSRGIYEWSGLPLGRWHTVDDYRSAVEFGMSQRNVAPREHAFHVFKRFFEKLGDVGRPSSQKGLIHATHQALRDMEL